MEPESSSDVQNRARAANLVFLAITALIIAGEERIDWRMLTVADRTLMGCFLSGCVSLIAAWKWPLAGGLAALIAVSLFYVVELASTGLPPRGWMLPMMAICAALFIGSAGRNRRHATRSGV